MGQLLFCSHALAKKPYDIESASLNIYSLEEMRYYLMQNLWRWTLSEGHSATG